MKKPTVNIAHSVKQRLANIASARHENYQDVLGRYGIERILDRLSRSPHAQDFVLKGAQLFLIWTGQYYRPTHDMDLMSSGVPDGQRMAEFWRDICAIGGNDGIEFDPASVRAEEIKANDEYKGIRISLTGRLERTRIAIQIDVGFGDAITPDPVEEAFPVLLDMLPPRLRIYPRETTIAEKFEAMVQLGNDNTRMKDFFDLWVLSRHFAFEGNLLRKAVAATFARRKTSLPDQLPTAFSPHFHDAEATRKRWDAFLLKGRFQEADGDFKAVCDAISAFIMPVAQAIARNEKFDMHWPAGGPWR